MATPKPIKKRLKDLKQQFDQLCVGKDSLLKIIDESELPETVYNSNAIENSTLTLKETEKILLDMEISRDIDLREVYETKNLARVVEYNRGKALEKELSKDIILLLHNMLIGVINDSIAGRFRVRGEYVRVGTHIAPPPEHVEAMIDASLLNYTSDHETYFIDKITRFHLEFERVHPFNDGNGRIGRVLINYQLGRLGFPPIIIRNKEKKEYYEAFRIYDQTKTTKIMEKIIALALMESLHKRIIYLENGKIVELSQYIKRNKLSSSAVTNSARRQTIPAFRERGVWKIDEGFQK